MFNKSEGRGSPDRDLGANRDRPGTPNLDGLAICSPNGLDFPANVKALEYPSA